MISINKKLIFSDLHCLTITVLHDFALFHQLNLVSNKLATEQLHICIWNTALFHLWMNLRLNKSSKSIQLLIHKDSHCPSPNVYTIHPKCDISHFQYYLGQIVLIVCSLGRRDLLCSRMNQPFERINWMNDSVIKFNRVWLQTCTCTHRHSRFSEWCHLQSFLFFILFYLLIIFSLNLSTFYNSSQVVKTRKNKQKYNVTCNRCLYFLLSVTLLAFDTNRVRCQRIQDAVVVKRLKLI